MSCLARRSFLLFLALLPLACTTTPESRYFALNGVRPDPLPQASSLVLAVGPIDLPRYLDRPQIVTRAGGNQLNVDEFNRWGGALDEEIARVLAEHIGRRMQTQRIYSYPSRLTADIDYRVALDIRAFDGPLGGEVSLDVAWSLVADRSGDILSTEQGVYRGGSRGADYDAYVAAMSEALAALGDDLARSLRDLPLPKPVR